MKNFLFSLLLVAVVVMTMSGCSKSAEDKLTGHAWKQTGFSLVTSTGDTFDFFALFPACSKDDLITFNENGTGTNDEGATKCNATDPQTYDAGTWSLSDDGNTLTLVSDGDTTVLTITELSSDVLKGTIPYVDPTAPANSGTVTATWEKP